MAKQQTLNLYTVGSTPTTPTNWLRLAQKASKRSTHPKYRMGAVVVSGGRLLSLASNLSRRGRHAEVRALQKLQRGRLPAAADGCTVYVMRSDAGTSRPCGFCRAILLHAGVDRVVYIDVFGNVRKEVL